MGSNILRIKGGSVLVEKMHTPETKSIIFNKKISCGGRLSCNLLLGLEAPISYDFHLEQADS